MYRGLYFLFFLLALGAMAQHSSDQRPPTQPSSTKTAQELKVTAGKAIVYDSPLPIERLAVANANVAEAVVVTPREVLVTGKVPGETTLIVWPRGAPRQVFDLRVARNTARLEAVRRLIREELKDP